MGNQAIGSTPVLQKENSKKGTFSVHCNFCQQYCSKVKGNLKRHYTFWQKCLKASPFILDVIENGYKIPLRYIPQPYELRSNQSAFKNQTFVESAIIELLNNDLIYQVDTPYICNPLSVAESSSGKKRLILDLSVLNQYIWKQKIKYDDWKIFSEFVDSSEEGFLFKFDLKSGYHHIDINRDFQKYLGFSWSFKGKKVYFQFSVLPFGLSSAPHIFTKIVRVLIKYWRSFSIRIACFIDDGFSIDYLYERALKNSDFVRESIKNSGFIENSEKSQWIPLTSLEWLGIILDLKTKTYSISEKRITSILVALEKIFNTSYVTARQLASCVGKIISTKFVLGDVTRLKTRSLYKVIIQRASWDSSFNISYYHYAIDELLFWKLNIKALNNRLIFNYSVPSLKVFSDASAMGIGAIVCDKVCYRNLNEPERNESSTYRELLAILYAVRAFDSVLEGNFVLWHTDNLAATTIVKVGSNNLKLHKIAIDIFRVCKDRNISLKVTWISRTLNKQADYISRSVDYDDWSISQNFFKVLDTTWGPFSIDLFANDKNAKCRRFCSRFWCPNVFKVDAFSFDWKDEICLIVPPTSLITKTIKHFLASRGSVRGVLVTPYWPSSPFWPFLIDENQNFKPYVKAYRLLNSSKVIVPGDTKNVIFGNDDLEILICAFLINR